MVGKTVAMCQGNFLVKKTDVEGERSTPLFLIVGCLLVKVVHANSVLWNFFLLENMYTWRKNFTPASRYPLAGVLYNSGYHLARRLWDFFEIFSRVFFTGFFSRFFLYANTNTNTIRRDFNDTSSGFGPPKLCGGQSFSIEASIKRF